MISVIAWLWALSFLLWCVSWWLAYRQKKLLFWLFWNSVVGFVLWMVALVGAVGGVGVLLLWYCSLLAIPFWWLIKLTSEGSGGRSQPHDYSDLEPIVDEHGKQLWP